jgi:hypothetical protein
MIDFEAVAVELRALSEHSAGHFDHGCVGVAQG